MVTKQKSGIYRTESSRSAVSVRKDEEFVQELIQCGFRIEKLASTRGRSLRQFERDFLQEFRCRPREMIQQIRMKLALERLQSDARVNEIATELGYQHASDFGRAFKAYHGVNPSEMRQKVCKEPSRFMNA